MTGNPDIPNTPDTMLATVATVVCTPRALALQLSQLLALGVSLRRAGELRLQGELRELHTVYTFTS